MESELDEIEDQLVKLEAELAETIGDKRRVLEQQIERLKDAREEALAAGDVALGAGENDALQDEIADARASLRNDIP